MFTSPESYRRRGRRRRRFLFAAAATLIQFETVNAALTFSYKPPFIHYSPSSPSLSKRADLSSYGFYDPHIQGGNMLTVVENTFPEGLGEPLNVIISAYSDADVLKDREDSGGLRNFFLSLNFSSECLGQSLGSIQRADLGDGNGVVDEAATIRYNYGDAYVGSCQETIDGGNHFRYWIQDGKDGNSGAVFLAVSVELPIAQGHDIVVNGYNLGRDWLVGNATNTKFANPNQLSVSPVDPEVISVSYESVASVFSTSVEGVASALSASLAANASLTIPPTLTQSVTAPATTSTIVLNESGGTGDIQAVQSNSFVGRTSYNGYTYETTAIFLSGLLGNTSAGVNHYITVEQDDRPAMDGLVAVLNVKIVGRPQTGSSIQTSINALIWTLPLFATILSLTLH